MPGHREYVGKRIVGHAAISRPIAPVHEELHSTRTRDTGRKHDDEYL